jgi:AraC family transcriptional regulator, regulatory protein of adaptative response / methylated-DNA-[protein]-cysteine methyltransferase
MTAAQAMRLMEAPDSPETDSRPRFEDEAACWAAVQKRDRRADGHFFFAVRTTGVYCKPSCAARLPKRENVIFFTAPEGARHAGFRACKRCRPDLSEADSPAVQAVTAAARSIEAAVEGEDLVPSLDQLAERAGYSPFHFHRLFKKILGLTPKNYINALRSQRVRQELSLGSTVTEAIHGAGYSSSSRFYETAAARLGMAPTAHRKGGEGETIRYSVGATSLGLILVAATDRGICAIQFGDKAADLVAQFRSRFSKANLVGDDEAFRSTIDQVVRFVEAPQFAHELPLDVRGTAFQERVWQALQTIPVGQTSTYSEIAAKIGQPKAVRAVAQACAANPAAVVVPCHRVVRSNGDLSGYRWGVKRKAELLKREGGR